MITKYMTGLLLAMLWLLSTPAAAQDTTVRVGVLGPTPDGVEIKQQLSTAEVDALLRTFFPSRYGPHYTRDKLNAEFAKLQTLSSALAAQLVTTIQQSAPQIELVTSVVVDTSALELTLQQTSNGIKVSLSGLRVTANVKAHHWALALVFPPHHCSSLHASVRLGGISVFGTYDIPTGTLQDAGATYGIESVNTNCSSGIFGNPSAFFVDVFGPGLLRSLVQDKIRDTLREQLALVNMREIFSIRDLLESFRNFSNIAPLNALANRAIDAGQEIVANPSQLNRALRLDVRLRQSASGNTIDFIASHATSVNIVAIGYSQTRTFISVELPPDTSTALLYQRHPVYTTSWYPLATTTTDGLVEILGTFEVGTQIIAVGRNRWHDDLHSRPGTMGVTTYNPICTGDCGPLYGE